jgi:hypothetical protein
MSLCQCRIGFFTLRDCEHAATATCSKCSRGVCGQHRDRSVPGTTLCLECAAIEEQAGRLPPVAAKTGGSFGGRSFYRRRDDFYRVQGHRPVYWGTLFDPFYDRYDVCAFHTHVHFHDHHSLVDDDSDQDVAASLMDS